MSEESFSVLMSIYAKESPTFFRDCLKSILIYQTILPTEIVLVADGPLTPDLESIIFEFQEKFNDIFKIVRFETNKGLGFALRYGLLHCSYEIVLRMDTDDISVPNRFELQLNYFRTNPHLAIIGGNVLEFTKNIEDGDLIRNVPISSSDINRVKNFRNPFNHMSVGYRKSFVMECGNYRPMNYYEDYYLWLRVLSKFRGENIPEILVYARTGSGMIKRRIGFKMAINEIRFQISIWNESLITLIELIRNLALRVPPKLFPNVVNKIIYMNLLRRKI